MRTFLRDFTLPAAFAGFVTFLIGISVSSVLVIQAAQILGATTSQITSWFWALGIGIGASGLFYLGSLNIRSRHHGRPQAWH